MLMVEWNMDDALAVRYEEGREEVAQNMLQKGFSHEQIAELCNLDIKRVRELSTGKSLQQGGQ